MESITTALSVLPPEPTIIALALLVAAGYYYYDQRNHQNRNNYVNGNTEVIKEKYSDEKSDAGRQESKKEETKGSDLSRKTRH